MYKIISRFLPLGLLFFLSPSYVLADEISNANTSWILTSTVLVLFMTLPGLAFFYAGLVRSKNVLSVLMQCFSLTCLVSLMWVVYLYSWTFGDGGSFNAFVGNLDNLFLSSHNLYIDSLSNLSTTLSATADVMSSSKAVQ